MQNEAMGNAMTDGEAVVKQERNDIKAVSGYWW
jgi:hypothetical protein